MGKRSFQDPPSKGVQVKCYLCGKTFSRLDDLKGRHWREYHPNVKYNPPSRVPSGMRTISSIFEKRQRTDGSSSSSAV